MCVPSPSTPRICSAQLLQPVCGRDSERFTLYAFVPLVHAAAGPVLCTTKVKIKVLVAEGNLGGRGRRQAAELHQVNLRFVLECTVSNDDDKNDACGGNMSRHRNQHAYEKPSIRGRGSTRVDALLVDFIIFELQGVWPGR